MNIISDLIERHASEIPLWGHLPAAMRFKQAVVERVGVDAAFSLVRGELNVPGIDLLRQRRIVGMRVAAAERAIVFRELWPGGHRFDRPEPKVIGASNHAPMPGVDRAAYLACFPDVTIRCRSALLLSGEDGLVDFEGDEYTRMADNPGYDPGVLHAQADRLWTMEALSPALEIDEAFMLSGSHSVDFGHWMTEYLPKLAIAMLAGLPAGIPVLVDQIIPSTIREALASLLPAGTELITIPHLAAARVRRLWCVPAPVYSGFYPTEWNEQTWSHIGSEPRHLAGLLRKVLELAGPSVLQPGGPERIFLARKPERRKKRLVNHAQIEAAAIEHGFTIVHPEDLGLLEQIRLAHNARFIVAPEGSNALLAWFARAGAKACFLSPPYTLPLVDVNAILAELGVDLTVVTGPDLPTAEDFCPFWNDYRIDAEAFAAFLGQWAPQGAPQGAPLTPAIAGSVPGASS